MVLYTHAVLFEAKALTEREREKVRRHFQKRRSSGGGECGLVEKVGENTYSVSFMETNAQKGVLGKEEHVISLPCGNLTLSVRRPQPMVCQVFNLDPYLLRFLKESPKAAEALQNQLSSIDCSVKLLKQKAIVRTLGTVSDQWKQQVDQIFTGLLDIYGFYYETNPVRLDVLLQNPSSELQDLTVYNEGDYAVIVGKVKEVEKMTRMVEERLQTRKECPAPETQYNLVEEEFKNYMNTYCPGVRITRNGSNIILCGPRIEVWLGSIQLNKLINNIKEKQIQFPMAMLYFMKSNGAFCRYQAQFQQSLCSPVSLETRLNLVLSSLSSEALEEAAAAVQRDLRVQTLQLEGAVAVAPALDQLEEALTEAKTQVNRGGLRVEVSYHPGPIGTTTSKVQLVGYSEDVNKLKEVVLFYKMKYVEVRELFTLPHPEMVDNFDKVLSLTGLCVSSVKLRSSHIPSPSVLLSGPSYLVQEAQKALDSAMTCLASDKLVLNGSGAQWYFQGEGKRSMEQVENSCNVLILKQHDGQGSKSATSCNQNNGGDNSSPSTTSTPVNQTHLVVKFGSLEEQQVDVLVVPMVKTQATSTTIGTCVLKKAGSQVKINFELATGGRRRIPGEVLQVTGTPSLGPSKILFIECLPWDGARGASVKALQSGLRKVLELCAQQGWGSVALPVIGPGALLKFPWREAVEVLTEEIGQFGRAGTTGSVSTIRIVIKPDYPDSEQVFQGVYRGLSSSMTNWQGQVSLSSDTNPDSSDPPRPWRLQPLPPAGLDLRRILPTSSFAIPHSAFLILGPSKEGVAQAAMKLQRLYQTQCCQYSFTRERLVDLTQEEADKLGKVIKTLDLRFEQNPGQVGLSVEGHLIVTGLKDGVHQVVQLISGGLPDSVRREMKEKEEDEVHRRVSWCILGHTGDWVRLPKSANHMLEKREVLKGVVDEQGVQWHIDLQRMEATDQGTRQVAKLKRLQNLPDFSLPLYWDNMASGEQLKMVTLHPSSAEFKRVNGDFLRTATHTVDKIQRIQNMHLRQAYELHLSHISAKNVQGRREVEKLLYHGTTHDSCQSIMETGFNRSLAGKNGASYGHGTYFAVDASYSIRYSHAGREGSRPIFVVRVLTGWYTPGESRMRAPLPHFNSVVNNLQNPSMFVVFNDSAAYPDYLITFK